MKRPTGRQALYGGLVVMALALAAALTVPRPIAVDVESVRRGGLEVVVEEEGETRVRERYLVSAPTSGRVLRIDLEAGDRVTAGEARALAEQARAQLRSAEAEVTRRRELSDSGILSEEQLESAETLAQSRREAAAAAEFRVRAAEGELSRQQARLRGYGAGAGSPTGAAVPVVAPVSGSVLRVLHESSAVVPAGEPLLEVGDPAQLEIVADYLSSDAVRISAEQRVRIERWGGEGALPGRVRRVEPSGFTKISALGVEEQRVNVVIDFDRQPAGLGDGFRVEVAVVIAEHQDVLLVPASALFRRGDAWHVFVLGGGRARERPVSLGERTAHAALVHSGLAEGERVVVFPGAELTSGARVRER